MSLLLLHKQHVTLFYIVFIFRRITSLPVGNNRVTVFYESRLPLNPLLWVQTDYSFRYKDHPLRITSSEGCLSLLFKTYYIIYTLYHNVYMYLSVLDTLLLPLTCFRLFNLLSVMNFLPIPSPIQNKNIVNR